MALFVEENVLFENCRLDISTLVRLGWVETEAPLVDTHALCLSYDNLKYGTLQIASDRGQVSRLFRQKTFF